MLLLGRRCSHAPPHPRMISSAVIQTFTVVAHSAKDRAKVDKLPGCQSRAGPKAWWGSGGSSGLGGPGVAGTGWGAACLQRVAHRTMSAPTLIIPTAWAQKRRWDSAMGVWIQETLNPGPPPGPLQSGERSGNKTCGSWAGGRLGGKLKRPLAWLLV